MRNEISNDEAARLGCAGFSCGIVLLPVIFVAVVAAFILIYTARN